jgi:hypothetical protein
MRDQISGWPKTDIDTVYPGDELRCLSVVWHMLAAEAPRGLEREQFAKIATAALGGKRSFASTHRGCGDSGPFRTSCRRSGLGHHRCFHVSCPQP